MRFSVLGSVVACAATAAAFKDTSPFFVLSTKESSPTTQNGSQLQLASQVLESAKEFLSSCPTDAYIVVQQDGISHQDFTNERVASGLKKVMENKNIKHSMSIAEVVDGLDYKELYTYLEKTCGAKLQKSSVVPAGSANIYYYPYSSPSSSSTEERLANLATNDARLFSEISSIMSTDSYTIIYTTTPPPAAEIASTITYEPKFQEPLHMEMKRASAYPRASPKTTQSNSKAPLFEKYQFFTPGLFMGIMVSLVLLAILSVAITAVSSLQVSYGAFDKEMGPSAQKKVQ